MYFFQITLLESSAKKGRVRNRMGSGHGMGSVQQVTINSYGHIFIIFSSGLYILYLSKLLAPPCAVLAYGIHLF